MLLHQHHALVRLPWQKVRGMCRTQGQGRGVNLTHQLNCHSPTAAQRHWPKLPRGFVPFPQPCKPAWPRAGSLGSNLFPDFRAHKRPKPVFKHTYKFSTTFRNVHLLKRLKNALQKSSWLYEWTLQFSTSRSCISNHYDFASRNSSLQQEQPSLNMLVHTSACKYNIAYSPAEYLKTGFEKHTIILTLLPVCSRIQGFLFPEKLQFNTQITFQPVKVWLFCMSLSNTILSIDSDTKPFTNSRKKSVTSWTVPLRAQLLVWSEGIFSRNWALISFSTGFHSTSSSKQVQTKY